MLRLCLMASGSGPSVTMSETASLPPGLQYTENLAENFSLIGRKVNYTVGDGYVDAVVVYR
jgi:hypothetical protein